MHAVMREYSGSGADRFFDVLEKKTAEVKEVMRPIKGFVSYLLRRLASMSLVAVAAAERGTKVIYGLDGLRPNHPRNHEPKPPWFLAALSLAFRRSSVALRAASASASLFSAFACASRALCASAFAWSASLVARPAASFARCSSSFVRCSSACALARLPRTVASDPLAVWASAFARSSSFSVESAPIFEGSLVEDAREVESEGAVVVGDRVDGAGCIAGIGGEDRVDLRARTSRAISRQVKSSV